MRGDANGESGAHLVFDTEIVAVGALGGDGGEAAQLEVKTFHQPYAAPHQFVLHSHEIGQHRRGARVGQVLVEELAELR